MSDREYRLGCVHCDRDDCDFVNILPEDWHLVEEVAPWEEACRPVRAGEAAGSVFDWQTHLGVCPDCWVEQGYEDRANKSSAEQNDEFRQTVCCGLPSLKYPGRLVMTVGVAALENELPRVLERVASFQSFTEDDDAHGEHDFGTFDEGENRIFWKIDYYDKQLKFGSDNPTDPEQTTRVLTVMLAEEY